MAKKKKREMGKVEINPILKETKKIHLVILGLSILIALMLIPWYSREGLASSLLGYLLVIFIAIFTMWFIFYLFFIFTPLMLIKAFNEWERPRKSNYFLALFPLIFLIQPVIKIYKTRTDPTTLVMVTFLIVLGLFLSLYNYAVARKISKV